MGNGKACDALTCNSVPNGCQKACSGNGGNQACGAMGACKDCAVATTCP
jgi:hypothetical protein